MICFRYWSSNTSTYLRSFQRSMPSSTNYQLDPFGTFHQRKTSCFVQSNMSDEQFPLNLERVIVAVIIGHVFPAVKEVDRLLNVWLPRRFGSVGRRLDFHFSQPGNGRTFDAVNMHRQQIVAAHALTPRAVELHRRAIFKHKHRVGGVVCGTL